MATMPVQVAKPIPVQPVQTAPVVPVTPSSAPSTTATRSKELFEEVVRQFTPPKDVQETHSLLATPLICLTPDTVSSMRSTTLSIKVHRAPPHCLSPPGPPVHLELAHEHRHGLGCNHSSGDTADMIHVPLKKPQLEHRMPSPLSLTSEHVSVSHAATPQSAMATTESFSMQAVYVARTEKYESQVVSKNVTSRIPTTRSPEVLANHADELSCNNNLNAKEDDLEGTLKKVVHTHP
ncbi:hypothetical protein FOMPIDRAFT_1020402 [Fomitopsis schrenkii]|uniref:Uncharacterized protein n=1 Tax=Fomitopsis schrenkii TaxID=2126942 RepID=S8DMA8_FOMSC|nr:hypothetical protein FOMPIDRAFT_1020402 [Fomitopsis schrenkii]